MQSVWVGGMFWRLGAGWRWNQINATSPLWELSWVFLQTSCGGGLCTRYGTNPPCRLLANSSDMSEARLLQTNDTGVCRADAAAVRFMHNRTMWPDPPHDSRGAKNLAWRALDGCWPLAACWPWLATPGLKNRPGLHGGRPGGIDSHHRAQRLSVRPLARRQAEAAFVHASVARWQSDSWTAQLPARPNCPAGSDLPMACEDVSISSTVNGFVPLAWASPFGISRRDCGSCAAHARPATAPCRALASLLARCSLVCRVTAIAERHWRWCQKRSSPLASSKTRRSALDWSSPRHPLHEYKLPHAYRGSLL